MAETVILGLASILQGDVAVDGGPAADADLVQTGLDLAGSTQYETADGDDIEIKSDQQDDPVYSTQRRGATTFYWEVVTIDTAVMQEYLGGTVDTDSETSKKTFHEPDNQVVVEKTIKIVPEIGLACRINRASRSAKILGKFNRDGSEVIRIGVTAKVLKPTKAGTARVDWMEQ